MKINLNNELELNVIEVVRFMKDKCLPLCVWLRLGRSPLDSTSYEYCVVVLVFSKLLEFLNKPIWWKLLSERERKRERRGERACGVKGGKQDWDSTQAV